MYSVSISLSVWSLPRKCPGPATVCSMSSTDSVSSLTSIPRSTRSTVPSISESIAMASKQQPSRLACMPADSWIMFAPDMPVSRLVIAFSYPA